MSELSAEIGRRIRNYRLQRELSQEELAERCGLHPTYIGQVERGEKNATPESINKNSAGLSVPLGTLFDNIGSSSDYPMRAYDIVLSATPADRERLVNILQMILEMK